VTEISGLEAVYRQDGPRLWCALVAYSDDPEIASDAVAEAFAQALAAGDRVRSPASWIWRAAFKIAAGELQLRGRSAALLIHEPPYELGEPLGDLLSALRRLSPNQRVAVVLHDYADRPVPEIASLLGSSTATVYVHLSQGRRRLRTLLEDRDVR
jgi:RNA polymerase sigma-70 factor (ECF subfamily)